MENKLPAGWKWKKLGDLIELKYGKGLKKEKRNLSGKFPVYGSNGIVDYHNEAIVSEPCLIVGRKGSIGAVHLSEAPCWPIDTTYYAVPTKETDITFLFYLLSTLNLENLNKSTAIPGLNRNDVYSKSILIPPLEIQKKIASILEKAEETRRLRAQADELTQKLLQSVFLEMFGDPVTNPNNWKIKELKEVCRKITDGTHHSPLNSKEGDVPYITAKNITRNGFDFTNLTYISHETHQEIYKRCNPELGDVLYIKDGVTAGIALVNTLNYEFSLLSSVALLKPDKKLNSCYLTYLLNSERMYEKIRNNMGGAAITRLTIVKIKNIMIPVPPINMQNKFANIAQQIEKTGESQNQSSLEINNLFDVLMQKAFTGELFS